MFQQYCENIWSLETVQQSHTHNQTKLPTLLSHLKELRSTLPLFKYIDGLNEFDDMQKACMDFQHFTEVIILGTGGSSLGGQSLYSLAANTKTKLHFHDNIDPDTFKRLFNSIKPEKTGIIAISKSGNTSETLMQLLVCLQYWQQANLDISQHFLILTESDNNAISEIAKKHSIKLLFQPDTIGGRFAVFTIVGLLPALIAGLDVQKFIMGARTILDQVTKATSPVNVPAIEGAYLQYLLSDQGYCQSVLIPYVDRLSVFALWYRQLWAESLGKNGHGTTPIRAMGTVDQHSQLQLYLDGPKDKIFTVLTLDQQEDAFPVAVANYQHKALEIFNGKSMGQLMQAEQNATIDTLKANECPTRVLKISSLDESTLGALMMHYVLETIVMSYLLDVNPFDQPAVEQIKIKTKEYLKAM